jgi:SAM-dependent methyltransferase
MPKLSRSGDAENVLSVPGERHARDISVPVGVMRIHCKKWNIATSSTVLLLGAADDDVAIVRAAGFHNLTVSNITGSGMQLNAEAIALEDESYDLVFAHQTLHHCRSPYKALAEMLRVARTCVIFFEPNDSFTAQIAEFFHLKHPYEILAVTANEKGRGGVMDTDIPNYIHRWSPRELRKASMAALPEWKLSCSLDRYWDFNLTQHEIELSPSIAVRVKRLLQKNRVLLNVLPIIRSQGNHFFGLIVKTGYQPWIKDGHFDPDYVTTKKTR